MHTFIARHYASAIQQAFLSHIERNNRVLKEREPRVHSRKTLEPTLV